MSSYIAVVAGPDPGHALPALGVAGALAQRGHRVSVHSGLGHDATAAALGLQVTQLPLLAAEDDDKDLGYRLWRRAGQMAVPLADQLAHDPPDLVVADTLTRAGAFAAQLLAVPWVELIPHHLDDPDDDLPPIGLGRRLARSPLRRADDARLVRLQRRSLADGQRTADEVARSLGLPEAEPARLRLIGTLPGLERPRRRWPGDAHVVGPLAIDPAGPVLRPPAGTAPLVLVSDSTASGVRTGLGELALEALTGRGLRVVITSGNLPPSSGPGYVVGQGPHSPLVAAARLVVSTGGAGLVTRAAAAGVPQVVVPVQGDQLETAARLRDRGVARVLPLRRLSPARLRRAVHRQLADRAASDAAGQLAREAVGLGPELAAELIERTLAGAPPMASGGDEHTRGL